MTQQSSRKDKLRSTVNSFNLGRASNKLKVNNSLLNQFDVGYDNHMEPINEHFERMYEENHFMFPKNKSKIGAKQNDLNSTYSLGFQKYKSQTRARQPDLIDHPNEE